jgi:hypothetical protein
MNIEDIERALQGQLPAPTPTPAPAPKMYFPVQCSGAKLREIIRLSHTHGDDPEIKFLLGCIKARRRFVGGNERIQATIDRLKIDSRAPASSNPQ